VQKHPQLRARQTFCVAELLPNLSSVNLRLRFGIWRFFSFCSFHSRHHSHCHPVGSFLHSKHNRCTEKDPFRMTIQFENQLFARNPLGSSISWKYRFVGDHLPDGPSELLFRPRWPFALTQLSHVRHQLANLFITQRLPPRRHEMMLVENIAAGVNTVIQCIIGSRGHVRFVGVIDWRFRQELRIVSFAITVDAVTGGAIF